VWPLVDSSAEHAHPDGELRRETNSTLADKDWSLTDYLSVVVMERRRLTEALTTDHHFEQPA
jgi:predicted nucleic acid-binding protein